MRYLNKIVFINSASVQYAEIELDGNVHLIGTQGVGKSTFLPYDLYCNAALRAASSRLVLSYNNNNRTGLQNGFKAISKEG